jgi:hypothetical protein
MNIIGSIDLLDFDEEFKKLDNLNIKELIGKQKMINDLHKKMLEDKSYLTKEQKYLNSELINKLNNDYPVNDVTDYEADKNRPIRRNELEYFKTTAKKNNILYVGKDNKPKWIERITELIDSKKTYDHKAYMNEEVICECGCSSIRKNLYRHKASKKHYDNMKSLTEKKAL